MAEKTSFERFKPRSSRLAAKRHLVAVVAFDGVVLGDLATPSEVFARLRDTAGRPLYELRICSTEPEVASEHLTLKIPWTLSSLKQADTVIVPGIDDLDRALPEKLMRALRAAVYRGTRVASICSGAFVLAQTGALDGLEATTHWLAAAELARRFPRVDVNPDVLYVDNGNVLTSAGAAAGLDLCLHLVRRDFGAEVAIEAARVAVMPLERAGGQAQFIVHRPSARVGHDSMGSLLPWIEENLNLDLSLPVLAKRAAMSTRTLGRQFRRQVGLSAAQWISRARVRRAQLLLETTRLSVEEIAQDAGFGSSTVLRQWFRRIVGTSPLAYRGTFRGGSSAR